MEKSDIFKLCDIIRETSFSIHCYLRHGHLEKVYENAFRTKRESNHESISLVHTNVTRGGRGPSGVITPSGPPHHCSKSLDSLGLLFLYRKAQGSQCRSVRGAMPLQETRDSHLVFIVSRLPS